MKTVIWYWSAEKAIKLNHPLEIESQIWSWTDIAVTSPVSMLTRKTKMINEVNIIPFKHQHVNIIIVSMLVAGMAVVLLN